MTSDIQIPVTLRPGRKKHIAIVGFFVGAAILASLWALDSGRAKDQLWAGFFIVIASGFALSLHPKACYLHLAPDAFTYCWMFRACTVRWEHVLELGLVSLNGIARVAWRFAADYPGKNNGDSQLKAQTGYDEALPNIFGLSAQELYALMERLRLECLLCGKHE